MYIIIILYTAGYDEICRSRKKECSNKIITEKRLGKEAKKNLEDKLREVGILYYEKIESSRIGL